MPGAGCRSRRRSTTVAISIAGLAIVIAGKITLGRSFALLPANRGVVSTGVYRIVRHPIYMGYLFTHVAFLVASPSLSRTRGAAGRRTCALLAARRLRGADARPGPAYRAYQQGPLASAPGLF